MKTSKWCNNELNSSDIKLSNIKDEWVELLEARSFSEFKDELSDVLYFAYCYIQQKTKISLPMLGAMSTVNKVSERIEVWKQIFKNNNLVFNKKYLVNGSNHVKQIKVDKALELARKDQY